MKNQYLKIKCPSTSMVMSSSAMAVGTAAGSGCKDFQKIFVALNPVL
jgi:hypothetical protein